MARRAPGDNVLSDQFQTVAAVLPSDWAEKQKFSGTNQKAERRRPFGTGLIRHCPQGLFSPFFTFLPFSSPEPLGSICNRPVANPSFPYHVTKKRRALGTRMLFFVPYFSARLDFPSPPLSAPWSPRMVLTIMNVSISFGLIYCSSK